MGSVMVMAAALVGMPVWVLVMVGLCFVRQSKKIFGYDKKIQTVQSSKRFESIAAIVPTYNCSKQIRDVISILARDSKLQIFVVDGTVFSKLYTLFWSCLNRAL